MAEWLLFFFFLLILPFVLIFHFTKIRTQRNLRNPPGPPGLPFIGNLHQFDSLKPHIVLRNLSNKYGPLMSLRLGSRPMVVISSAKIAKECLKTHDLVFSGRPPLVSYQKYSNNGLDVAFSPYGEYWREMRKVAVLHLLSVKRVESFRPILEDEISSLIDKISNLSCSCQPINLSSLMINLTSSLICRIGFGKKYGEEDHEKKRFDRVLHESQALFAGFFVSDYLPLLSWVDKISGMLDRLEKNSKDLDLFYQELIDEHLNPNRPDTMKDDILDILIQIKHEQSSSSNVFTWDHIKAMLMNVFIAGTDTSSALITWAMTAMMQTPSAMKKVQSEIRDLVGKNGIITDEILQQLPYLDAVIKETFRLYPPVPVLLPRETIQDCDIEGYFVKSKTMIIINAWAIARDPECWKNPEDFAPERFLNSSVDVKGNDFQLIPFGAGRRGCPGISLAMSTFSTSIAKIALAYFLYSFDWELPTGMKIEDIDVDTARGVAFSTVTMHKKNPLCLMAKRYTIGQE
ncbi:OLC1v1030074C1 [Oldenlandia corymbosa var. corymbosa]|uniref:OLC1v1030074C1 n=1 Tax=Oldenlandia corymbosa var. corymbosa TaxID=529605 RepID=A0AAV1CFA8_OLDCO|nr:OLC1v1030074C1 [Oldenlandia corymbosa var. corymbosa]